MTNQIENGSLEALIEYIKRSRGFDFNGYKRASLERRIRKRMQMVNIGTYEEYIDFLEVHPDEFTQLFNTILINVTSFFRDPPAWDYLVEEVIPKLVGGKKKQEYIRVWSAGCSSGEEAYSLAMVLAEALGKDRFFERAKIYASDIDEDALMKARQASYTPKEVESIPPNILDKYLDRNGENYLVNKELRRSVIFGRHDLLQDAPISRIDLLVCRNVLMYFTVEAQTKILNRLHFALADGGFLFVGRAEMLMTHANLFYPANLKMRVFTRVPKVYLHDRVQRLASSENGDPVGLLISQAHLRDTSFNAIPVAVVVLNMTGQLTQATDCARFEFGIKPTDIGRSYKELQLNFGQIDLLGNIDRAYTQSEPVVINDVQWITPSGDEKYYTVHMTAIRDTESNNLGISIAYIDVTEYRRMRIELLQSKQELETALEELQSSNEELETTNEELQSTVEELETTNEELQSGNEELETMNEELQSSIEELATLNEELHRRTLDLNQTNAFLESVLTSLRGGVIVMNQDLIVEIWNKRAEDLWGLRGNETVGRNFLSLDFGLPIEQLKKDLQSVGSAENDYKDLRVMAVNRRGKSFLCRVQINPLNHHDSHTKGIILVTEEDKEFGPEER